MHARHLLMCPGCIHIALTKWSIQLLAVMRTCYNNYIYLDCDVNGLSAGDNTSFINKKWLLVTSSGEGFRDGECMIREDATDEKASCLVIFPFEDGVLRIMGI